MDFLSLPLSILACLEHAVALLEHTLELGFGAVKFAQNDGLCDKLMVQAHLKRLAYLRTPSQAQNAQV
jgi:hypothetical protein